MLVHHCHVVLSGKVTAEKPLDTPEILRDDSGVLEVLQVILVEVDPALTLGTSCPSYGNFQYEREDNQHKNYNLSYKTTFAKVTAITLAAERHLAKASSRRLSFSVSHLLINYSCITHNTSNTYNTSITCTCTGCTVADNN